MVCLRIYRHVHTRMKLKPRVWQRPGVDALGARDQGVATPLGPGPGPRVWQRPVGPEHGRTSMHGSGLNIATRARVVYSMYVRS